MQQKTLELRSRVVQLQPRAEQLLPNQHRTHRLPPTSPILTSVKPEVRSFHHFEFKPKRKLPKTTNIISITFATLFFFLLKQLTPRKCHNMDSPNMRRSRSFAFPTTSLLFAAISAHLNRVKLMFNRFQIMLLEKRIDRNWI